VQRVVAQKAARILIGLFFKEIEERYNKTILISKFTRVDSYLYVYDL
jgi:hypothetical protein